MGKSPFFIQVRTRGAGSTGFRGTYKAINKMAERLRIPNDSVYLAVGFFEGKDIRKIEFYLIPWSKIPSLLSKTGKSYRFRRNELETLAKNGEIEKIPL